MKLTINKTQKLFVFNYSQHVSCLGFYVVKNRLENLAKELNVPITSKRVGTLKMYNEYQKLISIVSDMNKATGFKSKSELIPEFIGREGWRVEVTDSTSTPRRFIIGKSTGHIPCHIELARRDSSGGGSVYGHPFKSIRFLERVK